MVKILVAEDDEQIRLAYEVVLSTAGYHVTLCGDGNEAAELMKNKEFDLLLTDLMMPNKDGIALAEIAKALDKPLHVLVITGGMESIPPHAAIQMGEKLVDSFLVKPVEPKDLLSNIENLLA